MRGMEIKVRSIEEMTVEARRFATSLVSGDSARVVALSGQLGAGKTTFVQGIARTLGVGESVTSPTFVIMKIYDLEGRAFERLIHMDAYRLKGAHHLKVLGWEELLKDPKNLICVEWPEKIEGAIPKDAIQVTLSYSEDDSRNIRYG